MGLIGFPNLVEFSLKTVADSPPFLLMQGLAEGAPEFVVMQPEGVVDPYELTLRDEDCEELGIEKAADALVLNIVTIRSLTPQYVTVNLAGPVIINRRSGKGRQIIFSNSHRYSTEHVLVDQRGAPSNSSAGEPALPNA
jgi:flagellar assembly factor FliW